MPWQLLLEIIRCARSPVATFDVEEFKGRTKVPDQEFLPWISENDAIWIHADDNAKVEHRKAILAGKIRTLWVFRRRGKMSTKDQLRVLAYVLPDLLNKFENRPRRRHYEARMHGEQPHTSIRLKDYQL